MKSEPIKDPKRADRLVLTTLKRSQSRAEQRKNLVAFLERLDIRVIPSTKKRESLTILSGTRLWDDHASCRA